ncbi:uncharacterized protein LOC128858597 [Anastrepha ludens]|uniref:uncharacterized protein LOC128858597 n=1 Tax=Anastrepha ludens TaxID=28586 RepID=UPI0023AF9711|nr:uncharacterized protein LOC128858597 [Anastrepha ludens]
MALWIYTQMVRPIILYGALVWWSKSIQQTAITKLGKVQRLACLCITGAMRTTPTGMEALLNLPPLHIAIQEEAATQALMLHMKVNFKLGNLTGHLNILNKIKNTISMAQVSDHIDPTLCFTKGYTVTFPERIEWKTNPKWMNDDSHKWYTDGSKTLYGVGAGVVGPRIHKSYTLTRDTTIFQAELYAIMEAVNIMQRRNHKRVKIKVLSDSQSVLKALDNYTYNSKTLLECHKALNNLASKNNVSLIWVPGHEGYDGNEKADFQAKKGADENFIGPSPMFGFNKNNLKQKVKYWAKTLLNQHWNNVEGLRHSKKFLSFNAKRANMALTLNKKSIRTLTGALTGHFTCNKHLHKLGITNTSTCRFCCEDEESMEHLIIECPGLTHRRKRFLNKFMLADEDLQSLPQKDLVQFISILNSQ